MNPKPWSHSALNAYELCPKKFYAEKVGRTVKWKDNQQSNYGKELHTACELRVKKKQPLALGFRHLEPTLKAIEDAPGDTYAEQKLALTVSLQPTGYFDNDVWVRAVLDAAKVHGSMAVVLDYKTGRPSTDFGQMDIAAAVFFAHQPDVHYIEGAYVWFKDKSVTKKAYARSDLPRLWNELLPRVERLQTAFKRDDWPATPNFLCRKYCEVESCRYHGVGA